MAANLMVVLTAVYVLVNYLMLRAIKRQAEISRQQAEAAKESADALLDSERAWIFVRIGELPDLEADASPNKPEMQWVLPIIQNYGRTPGRVTRIWAAFRQLATTTIPAEPLYENPSASNNTNLVLPPGIRFSQYR